MMIGLQQQLKLGMICGLLYKRELTWGNSNSSSRHRQPSNGATVGGKGKKGKADPFDAN
jgi:hypothetical protein